MRTSVLCAMIVLHASVARADANDPFADELPAAFAKLDKPGRRTWTARLSPPFPDRGPRPGGPVVLRYYAFAASPSPNLRDGEHVAGVWAEGVLAGKRSFEPTVKTLTELGVQGVRPVDASELAAMQQSASLRKWLEELAALPDEPKALEAKRKQLRPYYCTWKRLNGVIAGQIVAKQAAFFAWLACD